jgi:membrane-associated protein
MCAMAQLADLFLHLDGNLSQLIAWAGSWTYVALFAVVFCETGLVVTPFLPGDSFLFAAGSLGAIGVLNFPLLLVLFFVAAFLGNELNYYIGKTIGLKILEGPFKHWVQKKHLLAAEKFFEQHGAKAVVFARFMPIVRTVVPFTAGISRMDPKRYMLFNALGAAAWVLLFTVGGFLFGNIPSVKHNFSLVIFAIIIISFIPPFLEWRRERKAGDKKGKA